MQGLFLQGLFFMTLYVIVDYNFEYVVLAILNLHVCSFISFI